MSIPSQEYKDFSLRVHNKWANQPVMGQLELTYRCNLHCQHCYIVNNSKKQELKLRELCSILDEVYKEGCLWLCLTGGEPLLREDFLDIYSYVHKKGFLVNIFTNATLLNDRIAKFLQRFPPFCIEVTLNAVTKKTYELITQTTGSFEKAIAGIELIRKYNLPLKLKCQAMALNIDEFPLMRKFYEEIGVEFRSSIIIDPRRDGSTKPCALRLPIKKLSELKNNKEVVERRDEIEDIFFNEKLKTTWEEDCAPSKNLFNCFGGTWTFYISPFGELFFCNSVTQPSWDLRKYPFKEGFYGFFSKIRSAKFKTNSKCQNCSLRPICFNCPGKAYLETGEQEGCVPYFCKLAKLTAAEKDLEVRSQQYFLKSCYEQ